MIALNDYIQNLPNDVASLLPWDCPLQTETIIRQRLKTMSDDYIVDGDMAIHRTAVVESGAVLKGPCLIGPNVFIAAYAYLRGGVWLDENVIIGPACEIKTSILFKGSKAAHFNFIGDSVIGHDVNIEAGAIIANHRNEWVDKDILCVVNRQTIKTGVTKFGALVGDGTRIGANAVLAPGTILAPQTVIRRLESVDQASFRS